MSEENSWATKSGVVKRYAVELFISSVWPAPGFFVAYLMQIFQPTTSPYVERLLTIVAAVVFLAVTFAHKGTISWKGNTSGEQLDRQLNRGLRYVAQFLVFFALFRAMP